jgi:hypothetical protein
MAAFHLGDPRLKWVAIVSSNRLLPARWKRQPDRGTSTRHEAGDSIFKMRLEDHVFDPGGLTWQCYYSVCPLSITSYADKVR